MDWISRKDLKVKMNKRILYSFRLFSDYLEQLKIRANNERVSVSFLINKAIKEFLEKE